MTALGAVPVEVSNAAVVGAGAHRQIDGEELSLGNAPGGSIVTANVTFFGKALTLFAERQSYEQLTDRQRHVLQAAAERTLRHIVANPPSESALARQFCRGGRIVVASSRDLARLAHAAQPVYAQLERDPLTRFLITQIRKLKATTRHDPPVVIPSGCDLPQRAAPAASGTRRSRAFGPPATNAGNVYPSVNTAILRDGRWLFPEGQPPDGGTYTVTGNHITFVWPRIGSVLIFTFTRDRNGILQLQPVLPMDRGDQFVWSGAPWRRVGPPIKTIP